MYSTRSNIPQSNEFGATLLEFSAVVLVVLFMGYGCFVCYAYISTVQMVKQIAHDATTRVGGSFTNLHTGNQMWTLKSQNGCLDQIPANQRGPWEQKKTFLNSLASEAEKSIVTFFNGKGRAPEYFIEVRYVSVAINTSNGALAIPKHHPDPITSNKCLHDQERGFFAIRQTKPGGRTDFPLLTYMQKSLTNEVFTNSPPSRFAIPAGLFDVTQKQLYGSSGVRFLDPKSTLSAKQARTFPIRYLRGSAVIGIHVEVDLKNTPAALISSLENVWSGDRDKEKGSNTVLLTQKLFVPRATL